MTPPDIVPHLFNFTDNPKHGLCFVDGKLYRFDTLENKVIIYRLSFIERFKYLFNIEVL